MTDEPFVLTTDQLLNYAEKLSKEFNQKSSPHEQELLALCKMTLINQKRIEEELDSMKRKLEIR